MKFLAFGDYHLRDGFILGRPRLPVGERLLYDVWKHAALRGVKHVICAGDFLDKKNNPPLEVLLTLHRALKQAKEVLGLTVWWLRGNHETPDREAPNTSVMHLFADVAEIISTERVAVIDGTIFYFLPWYPEREFIRKAEQMATLAAADSRKAQVLIAHVGLNEGRTSASNIQLPTKVSVRHLHPDRYDLVLLGDYHMHQQVAENAFYLGAPIPHTFGDEGCRGIWLVDTDDVSMESLAPISPVPRFNQWTVNAASDLPLPGYNAHDYNRIRVMPHLARRVEVSYPDADIRFLDSDTVIIKIAEEARVTRSDLTNPKVMVNKYLAIAKPDPSSTESLRRIGLDILKEALT